MNRWRLDNLPDFPVTSTIFSGNGAKEDRARYNQRDVSRYYTFNNRMACRKKIDFELESRLFDVKNGKATGQLTSNKCNFHRNRNLISGTFPPFKEIEETSFNSWLRCDSEHRLIFPSARHHHHVARTRPETWSGVHEQENQRVWLQHQCKDVPVDSATLLTPGWDKSYQWNLNPLAPLFVFQNRTLTRPTSRWISGKTSRNKHSLTTNCN